MISDSDLRKKGLWARRLVGMESMDIICLHVNLLARLDGKVGKERLDNLSLRAIEDRDRNANPINFHWEQLHSNHSRAPQNPPSELELSALLQIQTSTFT